jgi:hypothetical protein
MTYAFKGRAPFRYDRCMDERPILRRQFTLRELLIEVALLALVLALGVLLERMGRWGLQYLLVYLAFGTSLGAAIGGLARQIRLGAAIGFLHSFVLAVLYVFDVIRAMGA